MSASRTKSPSDRLPLPSGMERRRIVDKLEERDGRVCARCGAAIPHEASQNSNWQLALVRKIPPSKGGTNEIENLQLTHRRCSTGGVVVSCPSGKVRYATKQEALAALEETMLSWVRNRYNLGRRQEQRYYECTEPRCGGWHLTSKRSR